VSKSERERGAEAYVRYYESLSLETLDQLQSLVADDVQFCDPFNDLKGIDAYRKLLTHMFNNVKEVKFNVLNCAWDDDTCLLRWRFEGKLRSLGSDQWIFEGMSKLDFDDNGKVTRHIDYWDSGSEFYERVPALGVLIRFIRRLAAVS